MLFCSLDAVKKSSKKKEARIQKEIVEVLQQASYRRRDRMMKFLALTSDLSARTTLTLISSFTIAYCFQKVNF